MGNGPSLGAIDFDLLRGQDCFGLNAAYRMYADLDFYPLYFGCFDFVVSVSHCGDFLRLMDSDAPIDRFFWVRPELRHPRAMVLSLIRDTVPDKLSTSLTRFHDLGNSGANAAQVGYCLGYSRIVLVGVDCRYVETVPGTVIDGNIVTVTSDASDNPNYWWRGYHRIGDRYNVPRANRFQRGGWELLARLVPDAGLKILNCSPGSALTCFPTIELAEALK